MMKRPLSTHRMIFACALAILSLSCSVLAQETPAAEGPPAQTEDSGISTPRRVAGLGVLAFLIGWMIGGAVPAARRTEAMTRRHPGNDAVFERLPWFLP